MTMMRVVNGTAVLGGLRNTARRAVVKVGTSKAVRSRAISPRARGSRRTGLPADAWSAWYERV